MVSAATYPVEARLAPPVPRLLGDAEVSFCCAKIVAAMKRNFRDVFGRSLEPSAETVLRFQLEWGNSDSGMHRMVDHWSPAMTFRRLFWMVNMDESLDPVDPVDSTMDEGQLMGVTSVKTPM